MEKKLTNRSLVLYAESKPVQTFKMVNQDSVLNLTKARKMLLYLHIT